MADKPKTQQQPLYLFIELNRNDLVPTDVRHNLSDVEASEAVHQTKEHDGAAYRLLQSSWHKNPDARKCVSCHRMVTQALKSKSTTA